MLSINGSQGMWNIPPDPEFPFQFFPLIWSSSTSEVLSGELILDGPADLWIFALIFVNWEPQIKGWGNLEFYETNSV